MIDDDATVEMQQHDKSKPQKASLGNRKGKIKSKTWALGDAQLVTRHLLAESMRKLPDNH